MDDLFTPHCGCVECLEVLGTTPAEAREKGHLIHAERYETDRHGWRCKDCCGGLSSADVGTCESCGEWYFRGEGYGDRTGDQDAPESTECYCSEFCRGDAEEAANDARIIDREYRRAQ
jgi:hypothetical protein